MPHYFDEEQNSPINKKRISVRLRGRSFEFITANGVFSKDRVDIGTRILIENAGVKGRLLDLGCGYGPVGITFAREGHEVVMTDINSRAVGLAKKNIKLNSVEAKVSKGDAFANVEGKFDTILLNPPQHAGKDLCIRMIRESSDHLSHGGSLQIVARSKKGGKSLKKAMEEVFSSVEILARSKGFHVYMGVKDL
ncbi:MAG: class I SAM-dependent methyltransferase [Nanobdellota archaeon]